MWLVLGGHFRLQTAGWAESERPRDPAKGTHPFMRLHPRDLPPPRGPILSGLGFQLELWGHPGPMAPLNNSSRTLSSPAPTISLSVWT